MQREAGPLAPGGCPTVSGEVDGCTVHWLGDDEIADKHEVQYAEASPLLKLLIRNAYTFEGLTPEEHDQAVGLIVHTPETEKHCPSCAPTEVSFTVADTNLCRGHNFYALETRK